MPSPLRAASLPEPLLVAAVTARPLAASARRGGFAAVVLDLFTDADTRALGYPCRNVCRDDALRFDTRRLIAAAEELAPPGRCAGVVLGAGFEADTRLMARLAEGRRLLGNSPETVAAIKDPARFFALLDRLGIAHPETRLAPPTDAAGWLAKRRGGAGGTHVVAAAGAHRGSDVYYQRFQAGRSLSVLFLADGRRACVVGWNEQWPASAATPFLYGGGMSGVAPEQALQREIAADLNRIVAETGLIGLNGLDYVAGDDSWGVIEINPRPTAPLEYYDADWPQGLLAAHIEACDGRLPAVRPPAGAVRGHLIIFAARQVAVRAGFRFPAWCRDVPNPGTAIPAGGPVCTVHAESADANQLRQLIASRQAEVESLLISEAAA
ncbi:MAG TPA: ATP-grasp domain-containing protein [Burkholderiales bacterium]|nr:ATP-grasp domain-containing protein [Burkholderiales bacterium]